MNLRLVSTITGGSLDIVTEDIWTSVNSPVMMDTLPMTLLLPSARKLRGQILPQHAKVWRKRPFVVPFIDVFLLNDIFLQKTQVFLSDLINLG